ncbi:MAG: PH domain-containing protein, partial [Planctomycetota bacterium]
MSPEPSQHVSPIVEAGGEPESTNNQPNADVVRDLWSKPRFLHPSSVIFEAASKVRQFIIPALVGVFGASQGAFWGIGIACMIFGGSLAATLIRYFTLRYGIEGSEFLVKEGFLFKRNRSVPIRKIQNVDLVQNVLHRIFGVAEVRIETAAGTEPEAILRVLTKSQIEELRAAIFGEEVALEHEQDAAPIDSQTLISEQAESSAQLAATGAEESHVAAVANAANQTSATGRRSVVQDLYSIPSKTLILAGFLSNRGAVLIGVLVGFYFQGDFWNA